MSEDVSVLETLSSADGMKTVSHSYSDDYRNEELPTIDLSQLCCAPVTGTPA